MDRVPTVLLLDEVGVLEGHDDDNVVVRVGPDCERERDGDLEFEVSV